MLRFVLLLTFALISISCISQSEVNTFNQNYRQIIDKHLENDRIDYRGISQKTINELYSIIKNKLKDGSLDDMSIHTITNLYNFLVIYKIKNSYPVESVMDIPGFFTDKLNLSKEFGSLDELEESILSISDNPLIHVLLNCGALSCPPLQYLDSKTPIDVYIRNAFRESQIMEYDEVENTLLLSSIFFWYKDDFNSLGDIRNWIADFSTQELNEHFKISYENYNWQLNDLSAKDYLYIYPTKLFRKGGYELKIFNNYYTQDDNGLRSNFFSSFIQLLIGTNKNYNIGLDIKLRSVNQGNVGILSALNFSNQPYHNSNGTLTFSRFGIAGIGPRIKYQPFKDKGNINILHAVYFVPMDNTEGSLEYGYFDYQNLQVFNNLWYEKEYSVKKRLFVDIGFHIENLKLGVQRNENHFMQLVVPLTGIYSYYPNPKTTFYALGNYAQKLQFQFDSNKDTDISLGAYGQLGTGMKYYLTDFLEIEGLYTYFIDTTPGRTAHTFNIALRWFK